MAGAARGRVKPEPDALRALWRTRERLVVLQSGFGDGTDFLNLWQAWCDDAQQRARLVFIAIDPAGVDVSALRGAHAGSRFAALADRLAQAWPPLTRNLHRLELDPGRVQLLLARGEPLGWLRELQARVDVFLINGLDLSADALHGPRRLAKALARLAARDAAVWTDTAGLGDALAAAGFAKVGAVAGGLHAVYRPAFAPRRTAVPPAAPGERHALIVGAGLAGCAVACALAEQGWRSTLIDAGDSPATMASGNPAGLFHGIVNIQDGAHARFNRAAALQARQAVQRAIDDHGALGSTRGLLRLERTLPSRAAMQAVIDAQRLPPDYVQALDAAQAGALCGLPLQGPAWFYPHGGWVQPAALACSFLQRAGAMVRFRGARMVQGLRPADSSWSVLDAAGQVIDQAGTVVLANAADALRLLDAKHWPLQVVRGQISLYDNAAAAAPQRLRLPRLPLAGDGYLLPAVAGLAVFGASAQPGDEDGQVRATDHAFNLQRLRSLSGQHGPPPEALTGRVGWRLAADDRLPLVGAVPDEDALAGLRAERLRDMPRRAGLHVLAALGARGIGWAALGGQILAAQISGAPLPLEVSLLRAIDPARFLLRRARRKMR
jgi:tRNA 5-methylaminomethyl-2-thiouridine biosynthesis bifunctional protein